MDKNKLKKYREILLNEKDELLETLNLMDSNYPNNSDTKLIDELSMYDNHPADIGTEMYILEQNMGLKTSQVQIIREIDSALERIDNGSYGICNHCGKEIEEKRLEVIPYTDVCSKCSNNESNTNKTKNSKLQKKKMMKFSLENSYSDNYNEERVEFDREDSLQSVLRFNDIPNDPSFTTGDNQGVFDEIEPGIVEYVDGISNKYYKEQYKNEKNYNE